MNSSPIQKSQWQSSNNGKIYSLLLIAGLLVLLPLLLLTTYTFPGADDFGFAVRDRSLNFWLAQKEFYFTWSGRYAATAIQRVNPLIWSSLIGYQAMLAALLLFFCGSLFLLARTFFKGILNVKQQLAISALFLLLYIGQLPDLTQTVFWLCGVLAYQLPVIMFLIMLVLLVQLFRTPAKYKRYLYAVAVAGVGLLLGGSNEVAMLMTLSMLLQVILLTRKYYPAHYTIIAVLAGVVLTGALVAVLAPGNFARMNTHARHSEFIWSIKYTTYLVARFFFIWGGLLLVASVVYVRLWGRVVAAQQKYSALLPDARWSIFIYLATLFAMQFLFTWVTSDKATERVENAIYFYFLLGWFFNLQLLLRQYPSYFQFNFLSKAAPWAAVLLLLWSFRLNGNITTAYLDLVSGKAAAYSRNMNERISYLAASDRNVCVVPPLTQVPQTILFKDIVPDSTHQDYWVNIGVAEYFEKKEVYLLKKNPKAEENTATLLKMLGRTKPSN